MKELADAIRAGQAVLFVGSGATRDGGGASWQELAEHVAHELKFKPKDTPIETLDELCIYDQRRIEVYEVVQNRLASVRADENLSILLGLPWLTIYTTNYDTAIEDCYRTVGAVRPRVMFGAETAVQFGVPGELIVFKLMGSRTSSIGTNGEMVLSSIDRKRHQREEAEMYEHLNEIVSARVILAVGYSFQDNILLEAIQHVRSLKTQSRLLVYALFRPGTPNTVVEKLQKLGVSIIYNEIGEFARDLATEVGAASQEKIITARFDGRAFSLRPALLRDTLSAFDVVTEDECNKPVPIAEFLRGRTSSAGAYEARLHWLREAVAKGRNVLDQWRKDKKPEYLVVNFTGRPGSGRTVASNDLLHHAVSKHPCIGLRTPQRSPRLDGVAASQLMSYLIDNARKTKPPFLAVLVDEHSSLSDVLSFVHEVAPSGSGVLVVRSSTEPISSSEVQLTTVRVVDILLGDEISPNEIGPLRDYIFNLPLELRMRNWTQDDVDYAIKTNPSFIELMFRLVDPARRSIRDIVLEVHAELHPRERKVLSCLIVPSSVGVGMPITLLAKLQGNGLEELYNTLDECSKLVRIEEDGIHIPYVYFYHRRVADILLSVPSVRNDLPSALIAIVENANLHSGSEHQLVAELLVGRPGTTSPVSDFLDEEGVLGLFSTARVRGASRLLLHHYGLRLRDLHKYSEAVEVLNEAADIQEDSLRPTERKEIVCTTLAHVRWLQLKEKNPEFKEDDPQLLLIREDIRNSRMKTRWNPHSYDIEAKILEDLASRADAPRRLELLGEALGLLREGLTVCGGAELFLVKRIQTVMESAAGFGEKDAEELLETFGNGYGYYLLDEMRKDSDKDQEVSPLLRKALDSPIPCPPAIRKALHIELRIHSPDYAKARKYSDRLVEYQASNPRKFTLRWIDHLQRVACLLGSGNGRMIAESVAEVRRTAPKNIPQPFPYHLRSHGSRTEFVGLVREVTSSTVGTIGSHSVPGLSGDLFFNPSRGESPATFRSGDRVRFNLAIGVYGITAWDVKLD